MSAFGAFGKMPALGDFFQFGLPRAFTEPWDRWLQQSLVAAREALGDRWTDCYFTAPIWRFSLPAGLAGPNGALGVMMPSVDRVGRQFPLTIAQPVATETGILHRHLAMDATFTTLEQVALAALEDHVTPGQIEADLAGVRLPPPPRAPVMQYAPTRMTLVAGPEGAAAALAAVRSRHDERASSVWSSRVGECSRLMIVNGLPDTAEVCGLFDQAAPVWGRVAMEV
jgi:type VI secretion system protein ImpM